MEVLEMDELDNPFTPNAGATPPVLVGRDPFLDDYRKHLTRLAAGHTEPSMLITGLRGVGKTVLLREFQRIADAEQWVSVWAEVSPGYEFAHRMAALTRQGLLKLSPKEKWNDRFKRTARVLKSFSLTFSPDGSIGAGLNVDAMEGTADSGFLDNDLSDLIEELGEAAREQQSGVVFLFDEFQFLDQMAMEGLIMALHRAVQRNLPVTLVGVGLPQLPGLVGDARSYSERLFKFPKVTQLTSDEVRQALTVSVNDEELRLTDEALVRVHDYTDGFPYFVQEYGRALWNISTNGDVASIHVEKAEQLVSAELDHAFFKVRTDRASPDQLSVLRAMAEFRKESVKFDEIARVVETENDGLANLLDQLASRTMVYSPRYGEYAFTVPHYDAYLRRRFPFADSRFTSGGC
ncbi:ATP-binding protein [Streptomyces sp. NPDC127066]|uniref:ATP-binding protein n=1 Tax=Streptomyces sp. NPDC127066 TaxID=3347125 RepID=UPI003657B319